MQLPATLKQFNSYLAMRRLSTYTKRPACDCIKIQGFKTRYYILCLMTYGVLDKSFSSIIVLYHMAPKLRRRSSLSSVRITLSDPPQPLSVQHIHTHHSHVVSYYFITPLRLVSVTPTYSPIRRLSAEANLPPIHLLRAAARSSLSNHFAT